MARVIGLPKTGALGRTRSGHFGGTSVVSRFRVLGVPETLIKLGLVNKIARVELGFLTGEVARRIAATAKENINNITGNLESGTYAEKGKTPYTWYIVSSSMAGNNPEKNYYEYAGYVEFGTSKMAPRMYMTRAYRTHLPDAVAGLKAIGAHLERL
jgi:hypothetical protein